ncbi:MAG: glycosyltransferase family 4 protein [Acidobacteria bacterium]|nr:glycosyltransferase family 4 protein [Acidobacteriota bacterium]MDW7984769.1 glycosyltransferase family 4 protein [Acidobacteriota bacterium]
MSYRKFKIFMAGLGPLRLELGAPQILLHLATALRQQGHEVTCWTPGPRPTSVRWWHFIPWARHALERALVEQGPFDVVDVPPVLITKRVARLASCVIARTVQPDLLYLAREITEACRRSLRHPLHSMVVVLYSLYLSGLVVMGYHRASQILCLGRFEAEWLRRRFPWLRRKITHYVAAPSPEDRERLQQIRDLRKPSNGPGTRFLWIGRWSPHKGTRRLIRFIRWRTRTHPHDTFTIAGAGNGAKHDLPAELVHSGRVRILPAFSRDELFDLLATHDVGLFTSVAEGWGLALHEMLESGMPVYATETGAVAELRPWFRASLLEFPPPADGRLARPVPKPLDPDYVEGFSWTAVSENYLNICLSILLNEAAPPWKPGDSGPGGAGPLGIQPASRNNPVRSLRFGGKPLRRQSWRTRR